MKNQGLCRISDHKISPFLILARKRSATIPVMPSPGAQALGRGRARDSGSTNVADH